MNNIDQVFIAKYRWFILAIGALAQITFATAFAGIPVAGVIMRSSYHFTTDQLGFVLGCMGLGVAISEIVWGILTDKLGDKIVLIIGLVGMGAVFTVIAYGYTPQENYAPNHLALGGLLVLAGAIGGSINSSSGRAVMSWFQDGERGFAMSIRQTAIPVGGAMGSVIVPWIATIDGFRSAFLTLVGLCLLTTLCVWIWLIEIKVDHGESGTTQTTISPLKRIDVWKIALSGALLTIPQMAVLTFAAVFLTDHHYLSMTIISITLIVIQLGGAVLRILSGRYTDKHKNSRRVIRFIALVAGIASIILGVMTEQNGYLVLVLLVVIGLAGHAWHGIAYTEIALMSGGQRVGTALGMMGTTVFAATFLTPYGIPQILRQGSWSSVWLVVGALSLLSLLLVSRTSNTMLMKVQAQKIS